MRAAARNGFSWQRFALVWSAFIFVFFSASGSKLPVVHPADLSRARAADRLAAHGPSRSARCSAWSLPLVVIVGRCALGVLFGYDALAARTGRRAAAARRRCSPTGRGSRLAFAVAFAGGIVGVVVARPRRAHARGARAGASAALAVDASSCSPATTRSAQSRSTRADPRARRRSAGPAASPDVPFYSVRMYDQTLPYYLGRTVTLVAHPDELAHGHRERAREGDRRPSANGSSAGRRRAQAYAIMQPDEYDDAAARRRADASSSAATRGASSSAGR